MKKKCPLCGEESSCQGIDYGRKFNYSCKQCGDFITSTALSGELEKIPKDLKTILISKTQLKKPGFLIQIYKEGNEIRTINKPETDFT